MKNNNNNILLTIIGVATLMVAIVSATFAYFTATGGTTTQNVSTGSLTISAVAGAVNEANIQPVLISDIDTVGKKISNNNVVKLPITVNTSGTTISSEYNIYLTTTGVQLNANTDNGGTLEDIKWELLKSSENDNTIIANGTFVQGDFTKRQLNTSAISIPNNGTVDNYKLLIYILDDNTAQDKLKNLTITAFATVEAFQK